MNKKIIVSTVVIVSIIGTGFMINNFYKEESINSASKKQSNYKAENSENSLKGKSIDYSKDNSPGVLQIERKCEEGLFKRMADIPEISVSSDVVLSGKVIDVKTEYNTAVIYRLVTLEVTEVYKGEYKNKTATLFLSGGELTDDKAQDFAYLQIKDKVKDTNKQNMPKKVIQNENKAISELGGFNINDEVIVFLTRYPMNGDDTIFLPVGENQGIYKNKNGVIEIVNQVEKIKDKNLKDLSDAEKKIKKSDFIDLIKSSIK